MSDRGGFASTMRTDLRSFLHAEVLVGGLALGLGLAAAVQASRGNGLDEIWFGFLAAALVATAVVLLTAAARRSERVASLVIVLSTHAGLSTLPWWISYPILGVVIAALGFLARRPRHELRCAEGR